MLLDRVYYIGHRYKHHASHSGYEGYTRYVGTYIKPPVNFRWTLGVWGWRLNTAITSATRHPWYSLGSLLAEGATLPHIISHKNCLYHLLYGDSDLWLLGHSAQLTENRIVASFHQPSSLLRELGIIEQVTKNISAVVLVSHSQRAYFEEFFPSERIFVVPHGVNTEFFHPPQQPNTQPVCLIVGSHLRDFETLKQAISLIWQVNPEVRFIAVGTRNSEKNYLGGLEDERVQFLERVSDEELRQAYKSAQVALFPFHEATANNALLEAMASGLPIVATNVGGIPEYINTQMGVLCSPKDPQAFADGVLRVLSDSNTRAKMSTASRKRALTYDYRLIAEKMAEVYSKLLTQY